MKSMYDMVTAFPAQLEEAIQIGRKVNITLDVKNVKHILVCGMGGSGIGADFVASFFSNELRVPYLVCKSYEAPAYVNEESLVIFSSYSGNTEETLSALSLIEKKTSKIICLASGGKLIQHAKEKNYNFVLVPNNWPSPRACLGFSMVVQMYVLRSLGFIADSFEEQLLRSVEQIKSEQNEIREKAKHLANFLFQKRVIIYSTDRIEPVAVRFRQQINENAKALCWHHVIPEMNHNELVGWTRQDSSLVVVFLRNNDDHPRNQVRLDLTKDVVSHFAGGSIDVFSRGASLIEKSLYLVHLTDYVSVFLADHYGADAVEVRVIDFLKSELAKV